jgi:signal peptidase I
MRSEVASDNAAGHDVEIYQAAAREVWRAAGETGPVRLTVTSDSMRPLLRVGDGVVVQPIDPHALQPGDVIVVQRGGEWITHRLVAVDEHGWHTHGDDTCYGDKAASAAQIVGRVIAIERIDQTIDLLQPRWRVIDRRINRVQRVQLRVLAAARAIGGTRAQAIKHGLAALINWPFQLLVRVLIRF